MVRRQWEDGSRGCASGDGVKPPVELVADGFVRPVGHEGFFLTHREHALEAC